MFYSAQQLDLFAWCVRLSRPSRVSNALKKLLYFHLFIHLLLTAAVTGIIFTGTYVRRPSFPGCRLSSLEQSATPRHVCTVTACFLQSSEDPSLQTQFSFTVLLCSRSDTRHYGHVNRCFLTYLLYRCLFVCQ